VAFRDVVVVWTEAHAKVLADARAAGAALAQAAVQAAGAALTVSISESGCVVAGCEASSIEPSSILVPTMGATLLPLPYARCVIICGRQRMSTFSSPDKRQHAASMQQAAAVDAMEQAADAHSHALLAAQAAVHAAVEAPAAARAVVAAPVAG
jgi:hypothetical protein